MSMEHSHLGDGDFGMRESAGVPAAVVWLALVGLLVILAVGGFAALNSSTNLVWPASDAMKIPLGS